MGIMTNGETTFLPTGPSFATEGRILIVWVMRAQVAQEVESNCLPLARPRSLGAPLSCNLLHFGPWLASSFDASKST